MTDLPTSKMVTTEGRPAGLISLKKYIKTQSVKSQWQNNFLKSAQNYIFDKFSRTSGFYKNIHYLENLFQRQISDIMKDMMADVRNILTNFCPDTWMDQENS